MWDLVIQQRRRRHRIMSFALLVTIKCIRRWRRIEELASATYIQSRFTNERIRKMVRSSLQACLHGHKHRNVTHPFQEQKKVKNKTFRSVDIINTFQVNLNINLNYIHFNINVENKLVLRGIETHLVSFEVSSCVTLRVRHLGISLSSYSQSLVESFVVLTVIRVLLSAWFSVFLYILWTTELTDPFLMLRSNYGKVDG